MTIRENLPPDGIANSRIRSYFSKCGSFDRVDRPDCESNFAFVSFDSPQIQRTRNFNVNERLPGKRQIKTSTLLVSADVSIMKKLTSHDLENHFAPYGKIFGVRKPTIRSETTHFAFVQFTTSEAVQKALGEYFIVIKKVQKFILSHHRGKIPHD